MEKFRIYSPDSPEESQMEKDHRALAREVATESIVLLKNNGILPLIDKKVALYGAGAQMTIRGGVGSGDMRERYSVNIEEGLIAADVTITSNDWLNRFQSEYNEQITKRENTIEEKIKDYTLENALDMFQVIDSIPLKYPIGSKIRENELPKDTKIAIYVVSRQAGEGHDRRVEPGDFLLDEVELYNIRTLSTHFENVIIIVNCGSMIDISPLDSVDNIDAILFIGQGGTEGGNAVADILTGKKTPSGKLVDTWAKQYDDFPAYDTFSYLNGDLDDEDYTEGIYVGYRYFETFNIKPKYEFGFGLSYTQFENELVTLNINGSEVDLKVRVKNIGDVFAGKEIIQLYVSKPGIQFESEKIALCAFAKTHELQPNEETELKLKVDLRDMAIFDESNGMWTIEKGDYTLLLGNSSKTWTPISILEFEENINIEKVDHVSPLINKFEEISSKGMETHVTSKDAPRHIIDIEAFDFIEHKYELISTKPTKKVEEILAKLDQEDLVSLCVGGGQFEKYFNITPGVAGSSTISLLDKGIPNINMSDGPAGLNVLTETVILPDGTQLFLNNIPASYNWGFIKKSASYSIGKPEDGRPVYQYMTAWPAVVNQAQTWNTDLLKKVGSSIGKEMLSIGVSLWLAPGINIHRNPLCGRNFEYYSEDPYLTGIMAAAVISGVQSHDGIGVTLKHFCCNNQEDNRNHVSSNVSERALREIYLKAFKYVVMNEQPKTIMSSYNKVNGVYTANSYDLLTKVLRNEFGFEGVVMTDWNAAGEGKAKYELCQSSGNDLIMPGFEVAKEALLKGLADGTVSEESIERSATNVLNLIFSSAVSEGF